jgi:phosphoglycolate phosphatase-like HAD superfamily hydrolase
MLTAQNARISAIGVSWGFRHPSDLIPFSPLAIIDEANELLRYID